MDHCGWYWLHAGWRKSKIYASIKLNPIYLYPKPTCLTQQEICNNTLIHILSEESAKTAINGEWGNSLLQGKTLTSPNIFYIANQPFFWREKLIDLGTATASAQDKKMINNQKPQWDLRVANKNIFQTIVGFRIFLAALKFQTYLEAYL